MKPLCVLDLFSGIGGFSLGLERTGGFETVAFCEIDPFCRKVLAKHWPDVPCFEDVTKLRAEDVGTIDVITGGFPCQDISSAGKQAGIDAERSGLWSEIARLVGELRPRFVIVENVSALLSGPSERPGAWFGRVLGDLAAIGYDAEWHCIQAADVGAPHIRDRIWLVAYPKKLQRDGCGKHREQGNRQISEFGERSRETNVSNPGSEQHEGGCASKWGEPAQKLLMAYSNSPRLSGNRGRQKNAWRDWFRAVDNASGRARAGQIWSVEPAVGRVANGVPRRVDRLRNLGNAVVPQIPELIGHAILQAEQEAAA